MNSSPWKGGLDFQIQRKTQLLDARNIRMVKQFLMMFVFERLFVVPLLFGYKEFFDSNWLKIKIKFELQMIFQIDLNRFE